MNLNLFIEIFENQCRYQNVYTAIVSSNIYSGIYNCETYLHVSKHIPS